MPSRLSLRRRWRTRRWRPAEGPDCGRGSPMGEGGRRELENSDDGPAPALAVGGGGRYLGCSLVRGEGLQAKELER